MNYIFGKFKNYIQFKVISCSSPPSLFYNNFFSPSKTRVIVVLHFKVFPLESAVAENSVELDF